LTILRNSAPFCGHDCATQTQPRAGVRLKPARKQLFA
jgi:hypothetical protein